MFYIFIFIFRCVPCQCYGHSESCDPVTGVCYCQDNTIGDNCELCKEGFYGNPTEGTKDDCKPCPCKFGSRCILIGENVVCTDCPEGHSGDLCEYCQDGYYGDPSGLLGRPTTCQRCNCSGNIDFNAIGNCQSLTGDCLKCIYNTRNGPLERCELCAVGFYGNATEYPKPQCIGELSKLSQFITSSYRGYIVWCMRVWLSCCLRKQGPVPTHGVSKIGP